MKKSTLGLIETYGFIGAVEALDVALKTANVQLVSCEFVKGGIVTIVISGDVASVKAAVGASAIAVDRLGVLRNTHVIARAYDEVWDILLGKKNPDKENKEVKSETKYKFYISREELEKFKVTKLRTIARELKNISLTKKQIKFSKKEDLIEAILLANKRR
ncbi:microcompartment protein CcmL/EutN [Clostridium pascui]|nr:microcompartment protein CcmL/EutN [Clostridium pascui]